MVLGQKPDHPLYQSVDWSRVLGGHYAIVDPMDSTAILYLTEREYKIQVRVSQSSDAPMIVLATAGSKAHAVSSSSKTSPLNSISFRNKGVRHGWPVSQLSQFVTKSKDGEGLVNLESGALPLILSKWAFQLHIASGGSLKLNNNFYEALYTFVQECMHLLDKRGPQDLIMRFKACSFYLNKHLAGQYDANSWSLGIPVSITGKCLPRLIPVYFRKSIVGGNVRTIRMFASLFASYKAFEGTHKLQDLRSIIDPCPQLDQFTLEEFEAFCKEDFWEILRSYGFKSHPSTFRFKDVRLGAADVPYIPLRAGPNQGVGILGAPDDALAWSVQPENHLENWCKLVGDTRTQELFSWVLEKAKPHKDLYTKAKQPKSPYISKVSLLAEPAGKVRTIAIVDYWTHRVMHPVHKWMEAALRVLPTDATFDQDGKVRDFALNYQTDKYYSIDLKSATDLIPIVLYKVLFRSIWGERLADAWVKLLTDRDFYVPKGSKENPSLADPALRGNFIRYGRGQPMGALSSWPSMALVHHAIVLFSAKKAGVDPYTFIGYRVLGDDNVMGNTVVAEMYLSITERLQIPTSLAKSLIGKAFIFASQIWRDGKCFSPLSLKQEMGVTSFYKRLAMAMSAVKRGFIEDKPTVQRFLRLLVKPVEYLFQCRYVENKVLGRVSRMALIAAFGSGAGQLSRLGIQGAHMGTCLQAIAGRVGALSGRKLSHSEFEVSQLTNNLAISIVKKTLDEGRRLLEQVEKSSVYFRRLKVGFQECGVLATSSRTDPWTGQVLLNIPNKESRDESQRVLDFITLMGRLGFSEFVRNIVHSKRKFNPSDGTMLFGFLPRSWLDPKYMERFVNLHGALWPVIEDTYATLFRFKAEDRYLYMETYGPYRDAFKDMPVQSHLKEIKSTLVSDTEFNVLTPLEAYLHQLLIEKDLPMTDERAIKIWAIVDASLDLLSEIQRVPDFSEGLACIRESKDPMKLDLLKEWVRRTRMLYEACASFNIPNSGK